MSVPDDKTYLIHDPAQFNSDGHSIDNRLRDFIKNNLFVNSNLLNYDNIQHKFLKGK